MVVPQSASTILRPEPSCYATHTSAKGPPFFSPPIPWLLPSAFSTGHQWHRVPASHGTTGPVVHITSGGEQSPASDWPISPPPVFCT